MVLHTNHIQRFVVFVLCGLLTLILAACEVGGDYTPATPLPSPSIPALHLHTYRGPGYTIGYPQDWVVTRASNTFVTFSNPHSLAAMVVEVLPNPGGAIPARKEVTMPVQVGRFQVSYYSDKGIPPTITVAGDTWNQRGAIVTIRIQDRSVTEVGNMVELADNHPASSPTTSGFVIAYAAAQAVYDVADTMYFQPMLQSFRFI